MISYLVGTPKIINEQVVLMVNGVGYGLKTPEAVTAQLALKEEAELYIYTHVREDALELYGFLTRQQQELFELLISVSGIGPSTALAISDIPADKIVTAIQEGNIKTITPVPRVGKKLAQKIIIELSSKLGELKQLNLAQPSAQQQQVTEALTSLGFDEESVQAAVEEMEGVDDMELDAAIKQAIQSLGSNGQ
jgi:Holliday junction DNA helicase RuvA